MIRWADKQIIHLSLCPAIVVGWWCIQLRKWCLLTQLQPIQVSAGPGLLALSSHWLHFERDKENSPRVCVLTCQTTGSSGSSHSQLQPFCIPQVRFHSFLLWELCFRVSWPGLFCINKWKMKGRHLGGPIKIAVLSCVNICVLRLQTWGFMMYNKVFIGYLYC